MALCWGANAGAKSYNLGMAGASRRGYGEDGIYFDHRGDCRDSALHKTCSGRWRGVVSLGFDPDGKRVRQKVSGQTKAEVKDKLKALHSELDAGLRTPLGYTVGSPDIVIDNDGLSLTYSKLKLHSKNAAAGPRLRIEPVGKLLHAKVIEQRPRRQSAVA